MTDMGINFELKCDAPILQAAGLIVFFSRTLNVPKLKRSSFKEESYANIEAIKN